jgi:hypothetical protein
MAAARLPLRAALRAMKAERDTCEIFLVHPPVHIVALGSLHAAHAAAPFAVPDFYNGDQP